MKCDVDFLHEWEDWKERIWRWEKMVQKKDMSMGCTLELHKMYQNFKLDVDCSCHCHDVGNALFRMFTVLPGPGIMFCRTRDRNEVTSKKRPPCLPVTTS